MGLYIEGVEMPESCETCWNCDRNFNIGDTLITDWMCLLKMRFVNGTDRPDWCPLAPVPPQQPEQKRGKWIESAELSEQVRGKKFCSNCGKAQECMEITDKAITIKSSTSKFCPNCGAKMEESE